MATFYLQTKKKKGLATIWIKKYHNGVRWQLSTMVNVDIETWHKANRKAINMKSYAETPEGVKTMEKLDAISAIVEEEIHAEHPDKDKAVERIKSLIYNAKKSLESQLEQDRLREQEEKREQEERAMRNVVTYYDDFLQRISSGETLYHGKPYSAGSIKVWRSFGKYLRGFVGDSELLFDDITLNTAEKFRVYLSDSGLMLNSQRKHIICFKRLCNDAAKHGYNKNATSLKVFEELSINQDDKRVATYLSEEELQAMYEMPLEGIQEHVRDVFVLGTLLCQRLSDYGCLKVSNFTTQSDGTQVCKLIQQKTHHEIVIPIYDSRITEILLKYNYCLPQIKTSQNPEGTISEQTFGEVLKEICKKLAGSVPSMNDKFTTVLSVQERRMEAKYMETHDGEFLYERDSKQRVVRPKWDIITPHTARRTGITLLSEANVLTNREIMSISGHSSEKIYEGYIKTTKDQRASSIAQKMMQSKGDKTI